VLARPERRRGANTAAGNGTAATAGVTERSPFVPVRLVEDTPPAAAVEVVLRGGRVLRVAAGFSAQTLREIVATLEDLPC
jgi:hypothetical protein